MESKWYYVKLLSRSGAVVHYFTIKTPTITRSVDRVRSWLLGNNFKYYGHVVDRIEWDLIQVEAI